MSQSKPKPPAAPVTYNLKIHSYDDDRQNENASDVSAALVQRLRANAVSTDHPPSGTSNVTITSKSGVNTLIRVPDKEIEKVLMEHDEQKRGPPLSMPAPKLHLQPSTGKHGQGHAH